MFESKALSRVMLMHNIKILLIEDQSNFRGKGESLNSGIPMDFTTKPVLLKAA